MGDELRVALERDLGRLRLFLAHACGLRDLRQEHGFGGRVCARNGCEHARSSVLERNLLEVRRKGGRGKRPRTAEIWRREPPARDEVVDEAGLPDPEEVTLGVADPHEARAGHGNVGRLAGQQNQLARLVGHEDLGHRRCRDRLARQIGLDVFPVVLGRQFLETVGQRAGRRPRTLDVGGFQPRVVVAQIVRLRRAVLEQIPIGVDRELEIVVLDRTPDWLAVQIDDNGRRLAEEDGWRIGLDPFDVLRDDLTLVQIGEHPIERDHSLVIGNGLVDLPGYFADLLFLQTLEVGFGDLHLLEADEPVADGHLRVRLDPHGTHRRFVTRLRAERHGAERHHACLTFPAGDLGLINENGAAARQAVHAWPPAIDWRWCGRRLRGRRSGCGRGRGLRRRLILGGGRLGRRLPCADQGRRRLDQQAHRGHDRRRPPGAFFVRHRFCILPRRA